MPDVGTVLSTIVSGMLLGGMLALTALGLSIVLGVMRLVNLAHGDFLVVGAYAGLFCLKFTGVDPLLGLPVIACFVAALALPLYRLLLAPLAERGAEAQMMTMFAVSIILENVFVLAFSADTRSTSTPSVSAAWASVALARRSRPKPVREISQCTARISDTAIAKPIT